MVVGVCYVFPLKTPLCNLAQLGLYLYLYMTLHRLAESREQQLEPAGRSIHIVDNFDGSSESSICRIFRMYTAALTNKGDCDEEPFNDNDDDYDGSGRR